MDTEPKAFLYQCPACPWSVEAVCTTERGLLQPSRGLVTAHTSTHGSKASKTRTDAVTVHYQPTASPLCVECKLRFADGDGHYCQGCLDNRPGRGK